jgi:cell division transport system permease protein
MMLLIKRALQDLSRNRLLSALTMVTIALAVLIVSAFGLFLINAQDVVQSWEKGVRMMVYLKPGTGDADRKETEQQLLRLYGVSQVRFISKQEALNEMKQEMKHQASLLEGLKENPLPEAFEIRLVAVTQSNQDMASLAAGIQALSSVDSVEYGQQWLGKALYFIQLFRLGGIALGLLFFLATVFIVANTIRLLLYARSEEIEIMRLVGATDRFIKTPFFIEAIIQGLVGAAVGLSILAILYSMAAGNIDQGLSGILIRLRFFPPGTLLEIVSCSMLVGWIGCYLSLRQFLKS